jgi:hypothetical protein
MTMHSAALSPVPSPLAGRGFLFDSRPFEVSFLDVRRPDAVPLLHRRLAAEGIAFLEGIASEEQALTLARTLGEIRHHRDSEPSGLTRIACHADLAAKPGFKGFSTAALFPHTDQSCLAEPSPYLLQVCRSQAGIGGASVLVEGRELYRELARSFPQLLGYLLEERAAMFSDGKNLHCGPIFESLADGSTGIRFRYDSCVFFSPQLTPHVGYFLQLIERHVQRVELQPGQAYVINNRSWLHGREPFRGEREMWRLLLDGSALEASTGFMLSDQPVVA